MQALIEREHPIKKTELKDVLPIADSFVSCLEYCCRRSCRPKQTESCFEKDIARYEKNNLKQYQDAVKDTSKEDWSYETLVEQLREAYIARKPLKVHGLDANHTQSIDQSHEQSHNNALNQTNDQTVDVSLLDEENHVNLD